jgi:Cdc6-like AAA superfamily ATPase
MKQPVADVEDVLVHHKLFQGALDRIEKCFNLAENAQEPVCVALIGESRTGKSTVLKQCIKNHPREHSKDGWIIPILHVSAPAKPTVKGLAEVMLEAFGIEGARGTEIQKTRQLRTLMLNCSTRMLMIDEFQHFFDKGTRSVMHHVSDWLKILVDDVKCALVVAGLPSCRAVIEQNEQLAGRFQASAQLARFSWRTEEEIQEFKSILGAYEEELRTQFDVPDFTSNEMAFAFYGATGGLMGYLLKLLRQSVCNANRESKRQITVQDLDRAHEESIWQGSTQAPRSFGNDFLREPNEDLLKRIEQLGTASVVSSSPARLSRKPSRSSVPSINKLLGGN